MPPQPNPVALGAEVLANGRAHFADHCATCHGNDGKGATVIGKNLYPKAPDMTLPATQNLTDGEKRPGSMGRDDPLALREGGGSRGFALV